jgi:hypothetical protein
LNYFIARLFICLFTPAHLMVLISATHAQAVSDRLTASISGFFPLLGKIEEHFRLGFCTVVSVLMILPLIFSGLWNYANAATYDASGQWADFSNAVDVGLNPTVGDTYTYSNIFAGVDALVTVTATQKTGTGLKLDEKDPTLHSAWEDVKDINVKLVMDGSGPENQLKFRIDFLEAGTLIPITVTNLSIVNKDVEGPEFVEYSGLTGYVLANVTNVTASSVGGVYRFSGSSFSSNLADQAFWIETKYSSVNSVTVTVGRDTSAGSGSANRFALSFQSASWTNGITTAVPLPVRTITYDANGATSGNVPSATSGAGALIIADNIGALAQNELTLSSWNTASDGTGVSLIPGSSFTPSSDITVYAQYLKVAPTQKADVVAGLLSKELIAYQFYKGSIQSVSDRLAWLASRRGNPKKSRQGFKFKFNDSYLDQLLNSSPERLRDYSEADVASFVSKLGENPELYNDILKAQAISLGIAELKTKTGDIDFNPAFENTSSSFSVWSDGEISIGKNSASTISSSREFNRKVLTIGLDKEYKQDNLIGFALSVGREDADVGTDGSTIQSDNIGAIVYSTYTSGQLSQIEASVGYGNLNFETKRIDSGETLYGERKGGIYYGSVGFRQLNTAQEENVSYSAHGRVNLGQITLRSYSETGSASAITYFDQDIDYEELETGVEMSKVMKWRDLTIRPHAGLQYSHFLNKSSPASMRYTSLSTIHTSVVQTEMESGWSISAGVDIWDEGSLSSNLSLSRSHSNSDNHVNSINFSLRYQF